MDMKRIVVMNSKGGSGKSLLARELAYSFERTNTPFSFYDFDRQRGAIPETEMDDAVVMIADTPAKITTAQITDFAKAADVIVIPTQTGLDDAGPTLETLETARAANPKAKIIVVQNSWTRYRLASDYNKWLLDNIGDAVLEKLPRSEMFGQARAANTSVISWAPRSRATAMLIDALNSIRHAASLENDEVLT